MINNRQAGRRRGRGGNGGGNGQRQGGQGRADNGNRIDSRARGNASQLYEKYKNLAADAQRQGDRVNTEYYLQFADHYFRVLSDQRGRFEDQQPRRNAFDGDSDSDDDFGDEGEPIRPGEQGQQLERQERGERQDRNDRGDRQDRGERQDRQDRQPRGERPRRWDRDQREPRRGEGADAAPVEVAGQHRADPVEAGESLPDRAEAVIAADGGLANEAPAPRRRGRPRRDAAPVVEANGAAEANGFEADRLPPSLGIAAANDAGADGYAEDSEAPKPRRRRARAVSEVAAD